MTIDTDAWVTPLAYAMCNKLDGACLCQGNKPPCRHIQSMANAALAHLVPLIVERCAEEADEERRGFAEQGQPTTAFGAKSARDAIRALIPKGGDHA